MAPSEPRSQLNHAASVLSDSDLRVGRPVADPKRLGCGSRGRDRALCFRNTRPDVRQRDAERGRLRGQPVGDEQRVKHTVDRDGLNRHLGAVDVLLDDVRAVARGLERGLDRGGQLGVRPHEGQPALALAVRCLHDARRSRLLEEPWLGHAPLRQALPLPLLRGRERRRRRVDRVRQPHALRDSRRDDDRPVRARRDDPVHVLRAGEPVDTGLVLGRDDRALVRVGEAGRGRVAVDRDHEQITFACRAQEPDLRGPRS